MTRRRQTVIILIVVAALLVIWNPGRFASDFTHGFIAYFRAAPADTIAVLQAGMAGDGEAYLYVPDGRIWYRKSGRGKGTPVILLHGGPGYSSFYLKSLEGLGADRPVVRYDQLGGGKSDRIADTTLFTVPHFVRELDSLRTALGFATVHLVGHSWGTILAVEYYRAHPDHVASLTLASPALDMPAWERNARHLVTTLSDSARRAIRTGEAQERFDTPEYQDAIAEFYGKYVWRHPVEADLDSTMTTANGEIYTFMQGPSEFTITGTLKNYDVTSKLGTIKVPTLFTVGEFDEANPATVRRFAALVPGAEIEVIPGAAHITTWDNPGVMLRVVRTFLAQVDSNPTMQRVARRRTGTGGASDSLRRLRSDSVKAAGSDSLKGAVADSLKRAPSDSAKRPGSDSLRKAASDSLKRPPPDTLP